jgi:hypothetical protein
VYKGNISELLEYACSVFRGPGVPNSPLYCIYITMQLLIMYDGPTVSIKNHFHSSKIVMHKGGSVTRISTLGFLRQTIPLGRGSLIHGLTRFQIKIRISKDI